MLEIQITPEKGELDPICFDNDVDIGVRVYFLCNTSHIYDESPMTCPNAHENKRNVMQTTWTTMNNGWMCVVFLSAEV